MFTISLSILLNTSKITFLKNWRVLHHKTLNSLLHEKIPLNCLNSHPVYLNNRRIHIVNLSDTFCLRVCCYLQGCPILDFISLLESGTVRLEDKKSDLHCVVKIVLDKPKHNISKEETKALCELHNNKDLTIRKWHKGGTVIIMDTEEYVKNIYVTAFHWY